MVSQDFSFATELANTMNWNMAIENFEFMTSLEPGGCFVAFKGSKRLGIATCFSFGEVGWFGNLIVDEKYRGKGIGSLLVEAFYKLLAKQGCQNHRSLCLPKPGRFLWELRF